MFRYELSGLMPGALGFVTASGSGDGDRGEDGVASCVEAGEEVAVEGDEAVLGSGVAAVDALRRYSEILSLYASFSDSTDS